MSLSAAVSVYIKFFFLLTPFFILAVFLALTEKVETRMQRALAGRVTVGIVPFRGVAHPGKVFSSVD